MRGSCEIYGDADADAQMAVCAAQLCFEYPDDNDKQDPETAMQAMHYARCIIAI